MIPVVEFSGWISIIGTISFVIIRLWYCRKIYHDRVIAEIIGMALLTSIIWFIYARYKKFKSLHDQFLLLIVLYSLLLLVYFSCLIV